MSSQFKRCGVLILSLIVVMALVPFLTGPGAILAEGGDTAAIVAATEQALANQAGLLSDGSSSWVNPEITRAGDWAFVSVILYPGAVRADKPNGVLVAIAHREGNGWKSALQGTPEFKSWLDRLPSSILSKQAKQPYYQLGLQDGASALQAEDGKAMLSLPYKVGESWNLTGGPHGGSVRDSIDLSKGYWPIAASGDGTVNVPCANMVVITHQNGWGSSYYHLRRIDVKSGQVVKRGDIIGEAGSETGCGGFSTGPHVHFSLKYNGRAFAIQDAFVGGYQVKGGANNYDGYLIRNGKIYNRGSAILNDGTIGKGGTPTPTPVTRTPTPVTRTPTPVTVTPTTPPGTVFEDNFETNKGWTTNPDGSDTATLGQWERGDPEATDYNGPKQLGTTTSGSNDLVTGGMAGSGVGAYDLDGGVSSIRSPIISLPSSGNLTLSLRYYLAHASNASSADYLRVKIVSDDPTQTLQTTVFEKLGAASDVDATWQTATVNLSSYAGQTIRIQIEAADASGASLVEAAVDDVRVTNN